MVHLDIYEGGDWASRSIGTATPIVLLAEEWDSRKRVHVHGCSISGCHLQSRPFWPYSVSWLCAWPCPQVFPVLEPCASGPIRMGFWRYALEQSFLGELSVLALDLLKLAFWASNEWDNGQS